MVERSQRQLSRSFGRRVALFGAKTKCNLLNVGRIPSSGIGKSSLGVDFIKGFAPCAHLLHLAPSFCASEKLLKSWAQGANDGCKGAKQFMKSTPGVHFIKPKCRLWHSIHHFWRLNAKLWAF